MPYIDPTPDEILSGTGTIGGRLTPIRAELLRYAKAVIPALVDTVNAREGSKIRKPAAYYVARTPIDAKGFPAFIVGLSVDVDPNSPPGVRFRRITAMFYIIDKPTTNREDADDLLDLADLTDRAIAKLQKSHCNPQGVKVWNGLRGNSLSQLPLEWDEYSGIGVEVTIDATGINNWPQS